MIVEQSNFPLKRISDYVFINIGKTPSRNVGKYWGKGHKWLSIADMKGDVYVEYTKEEITNEAIKETKIKIVPENTVIYSFKLSIGKTGITKIPIYTNEAIASFPIKDIQKLDTKYLYYVMREFDFAGGGVRAVMGKTLNKEKLEQIKIPLPPLSEQQRIVAILDAADALRKKTQQIINSYDELAQSVFLNMFGDPVANEKGWEKKFLRDLGQVKTGNTPPREDPSNYNEAYIEWIKTDNINTPEVYLTQAKEYLSKKGFKKARFVDSDSILVTCIAGSRNVIGNAAVTNRRVAFNQQINSFTPAIGNILFYYYMFKIGKPHIQNFSTNGMKGIITKSKFENIDFILVPPSKQIQFGHIAQSIILQKELAKQSLKESEDLFQSLLQKAFKGELSN